MNDDKQTILLLQNTVSKIDKMDEKLDNISGKQSITQDTVEAINEKSNKTVEKIGEVFEKQSTIHMIVSETKKIAEDQSNMYKEDTRSTKAIWYKRISFFISIMGISVISIVVFLYNFFYSFHIDKVKKMSSAFEIVNNSEAFNNSLPQEQEHNVMQTEEVESENTVINENLDNAQTEQTENTYPNDYIIPWEDETFGELVKTALDKENVTYEDVKNIHSIDIYGQFMFIDTNDYDEFSSFENSKYSYGGKFYDFENSINLNDLKYFESLEYLSILYYKFIDCSIFMDEIISQNIVFLEMQCSELDSIQLSYIANLKNLHTASLTVCNINNVEFLSDMKDLEYIILCENNISDLSPISDLTNVKYFNIDYNNVISLEPLRNMKNLTEVSAVMNKIKDWSSVAHVHTVVKQ